jgi:peptidoglycan/LPS O-acetylase OafA/YrhL
MGSLRTIFAISVVFAHTNGTIFVDGRVAVQLFYVISGFLISYVLVEKKAYPRIGHFYLNRYLRLYPIYFVVALLVICTYWVFGTVWFINMELLRQLPWSANLLLAFSNLFIIGQDWVMFTAVHDGHLHFATNYQASAFQVHKGLLVPQAWTLGVELTFYLIAPFILFRRRVIYVLLVLSIAIRLYLFKIGLGDQDPWSYRFFPAELALFLLGALAHQVLAPLYSRLLENNLPLYSRIVTLFLIVFSLSYALIPLGDELKKLVSIIVLVILLPFCFFFQDSNRLDQWIGDLSYPIYINHMIVMFWVAYAAENLQLPVNNIYFGLIVVLASVAFAILLNMSVGAYVERLRARFRNTGRYPMGAA